MNPLHSGPSSSDESQIPFPLASADSQEGKKLNVSDSHSSNDLSNKTAASDLTSSDKLSALPAPTMAPHPNRVMRSPALGSTRTFRTNFDTSLSMPAIPTNDGHQTYPTRQNRQSLQGIRSSASDGEFTPKRESLESDRGSIPTIQSVRQAFSRINRGSFGSPRALSVDARLEATSTPNHQLSPSSHSRSRATSPLRILQQWSAGFRGGHTASEEPFIPIDPFQFTFQACFPCFPGATPLHNGREPDMELGHISSPSFHDVRCTPRVSISNALMDALPRLFYLHILLRLPSLYFTRVARVFEDAEVSRPDIQRIIDASPRPGSYIRRVVPASLAPVLGPNQELPLPCPDDWTPTLVSPALIRFKHSWETFIDSVMREWKTLNVVSALLLSAILTMFQIPSAASDPVTRTAALLSLISALMSLSYGCMYIVRFGPMRSVYQASRWAEAAQKTKTSIWWNVWVLLAMPAIWIAWAMLFFVLSILSFVWRTGSTLDPEERDPLGPRAALGPRIAVTLLFAIGMIYFILIVKSLKSYSSGPQVSLPSKSPAQPHDTTITRGRRPQQIPTSESKMATRGRPRERSANTVRTRERARSASEDRNRPRLSLDKSSIRQGDQYGGHPGLDRFMEKSIMEP